MAEVGREGVRLGSYFTYQDKSFSCMTPETWAGSVSVSTWMAEFNLCFAEALNLAKLVLL